MRRHLFLLLTFAAFLIGLYIAVLPAINEILFREKMEQTVSNFQEEIMQRPPETPDPSTTGIAEYIPSIYVYHSIIAAYSIPPMEGCESWRDVLEGCSKNREVIFQKVRSSLALSGTGAWFGTRDSKSPLSNDRTPSNVADFESTASPIV